MDIGHPSFSGRGRFLSPSPSGRGDKKTPWCKKIPWCKKTPWCILTICSLLPSPACPAKPSQAESHNRQSRRFRNDIGITVRNHANVRNAPALRTQKIEIAIGIPIDVKGIEFTKGTRRTEQVRNVETIEKRCRKPIVAGYGKIDKIELESSVVQVDRILHLHSCRRRKVAIRKGGNAHNAIAVAVESEVIDLSPVAPAACVVSGITSESQCADAAKRVRNIEIEIVVSTVEVGHLVDSTTVYNYAAGKIYRVNDGIVDVVHYTAGVGSCRGDFAV